MNPKDDLSTSNIVFQVSHIGDISYDLIDRSFDEVRSFLEKNEANRKIKNRVYSVLIECLQNLCNYHTYHLKNTPHKHFSQFSFQFSGGTYQIKTSNRVKNNQLAELKERLIEIKKMDKMMLSLNYNKTLAEMTYSKEHLGAGLGFLDIARKTANNFSFRFDEGDADFGIFTYSIEIEGASNNKPNQS